LWQAGQYRVAPREPTPPHIRRYHRHLHRERDWRPEISARLEPSFNGLSPPTIPKRNTINTPMKAKTKESGNHFSLQLATVKPSRTMRPSEISRLPFPPIVERSLCLSMFRVSHTSGTTRKASTLAVWEKSNLRKRKLVKKLKARSSGGYLLNRSEHRVLGMDARGHCVPEP